MNNFNIEDEIDIVIDKLAEQLKVRIKKLIERSEKIVLREYINEQKQKQKTIHGNTRKKPVSNSNNLTRNVSKRNRMEKNEPVKRNPVKRNTVKRATTGKTETSTRKAKNQSIVGKRVQREKEYSPTSPTSPTSSVSSEYTSSESSVYSD